MQSKCVIKFIRVSIQTFLGGQDDTWVSLRARQKSYWEGWEVGVGPAVVRFQTNVKTRALHRGET